MDADRIEKTCIGLDRHGNGICQAKDGGICPYWSIGATCSRQMTSDAIFVIRGLLAENEQLKEKQPKWIPVEERLPKSMANKVLVWLEHDDFVGKMAYGHYEKYKGVEEWYDLEMREPFSKEGYRVTHWMEKPKPPKEENV